MFQIDLEADEVFVVRETDRLGVYNTQEPGPVDTIAKTSPVSIMSLHSFTDSAPLINVSYAFDQLGLPLQYRVKLCPVIGTTPTDNPISSLQ